MDDPQKEPVHGNVLIIEDDPVCGTMILGVLGKAGYGVRLVQSRDAAVDAMGRYIYEHIILDYYMQGMSLPEFMSIVFATRAFGAAIILTTAENEAAEKAAMFNIPNWLGKPFTPEQLLKALANAKTTNQADAKAIKLSALK